MGEASVPTGFFLITSGGWIISVGVNYPMLWGLHLVGALILFFGLLYLFFMDKTPH